MISIIQFIEKKWGLKKKMSKEYDLYLEQHRADVRKGYEWLRENLPEVVSVFPKGCNAERQICFEHDKSKNDLEEYEAYDAYFYGGNRSYVVVENFRYAWLRHIHANPHHWQYWVLHNDEPDEGVKVMDMPYNYIIEMICDWWSFSWKTGNLYEIFNWYEEHKSHIMLSDWTRIKVEEILTDIRVCLDESEVD